jgi:hypothetical protein
MKRGLQIGLIMMCNNGEYVLSLSPLRCMSMALREARNFWIGVSGKEKK